MDLAPTQARIKKSGIYFFGFLLAVSALFLPLAAHAASLYVFPATENVSVGQTFTLSAYVSSPDQAMNAASGDLSFPTDKLQALSISKRDSIISLWIRDPSFTNSVAGGDINFQGIVLNPGFTGSAGSIITITFEAVGMGDASITYSSGAVLANDGNGTNILDSLSGADVEIGPRKVAPVTPIVTTTPAVTTSTSPTSTLIVETSSPIVVTPPPVVVSNRWHWLSFIIEWGLIIILVVSLLALIIALILYIIHRIRKWRVSSGRDLLALEETLRKDLKRIEKELNAEKRGKEDPVRKAMEHAEAEIKKDICLIDDIEKK